MKAKATSQHLKSDLTAGTVIVGAGSAGAVIAARGTERGQQDVLLLEAGKDYGSELPADLLDGTRNSMTDHDWGYWATPTPGQVPFVYPRGRVVGGSSAVNTCIGLRGQPYDFDEWELSTWSWEQCLPYFKKLENDLDFDDQWHGQDGPIPLRRHQPDELSPWQIAFTEACAELGFDACADSNNPTTTGYGPHAMNKIDGRRMNVAEAYLSPRAREREGLRLLDQTLARRVLFRNGKVCGIEVERHGRVETVRTERVILCGGAIGSLGVLLRSGIGPSDDLVRLGVEPVSQNASVGAQLLDHPGTAIFFEPKPGVARANDPLIQTALRYQSKRSHVPNDMTMQPGNLVPLPVADFELLSIMCMVGKPRGKGTITFESAAADAAPRIENHFLEDPDDLEMACESMELAWLLGTSAPMADLARLFVPRDKAFTSRAALRQWVPRQTGSGYHPCGTVPMGKATDEQGRVQGVAGLFVADASLFPTIPSANINLSVIMMGERFGEWLASGALQ